MNSNPAGYRFVHGRIRRISAKSADFVTLDSPLASLPNISRTLKRKGIFPFRRDRLPACLLEECGRKACFSRRRWGEEDGWRWTCRAARWRRCRGWRRACARCCRWRTRRGRLGSGTASCSPTACTRSRACSPRPSTASSGTATSAAAPWSASSTTSAAPSGTRGDESISLSGLLRVR
jgi:hypothetical protein